MISYIDSYIPSTEKPPDNGNPFISQFLLYIMEEKRVYIA